MLTMENSKKQSKRGFVRTLGAALLALSFVSALTSMPAMAASNNGIGITDMEPSINESLVVPNELIVEVKYKGNYNEIKQLFTGVKATYSDPITYQAWLVKFNSPTDMSSARTTLKNNPDVISIGRNFKLNQCSSNINSVNNTVNGVTGNVAQMANLPQDPYFGSEWHMGAVRCTNNQPKENTAAFNGVVILDNGVAGKDQNPDSQILMGDYDLQLGGWNASFSSNAVHGTMLATTLGAKWNNIGTAGVVKYPRTWSVRLTAFGNGQITEADLLGGMMWARANVGNTAGYPMATVVPLNIAPPYSLSNIKYHPAFHELAKNLFTNFSGLTYVAAGNNGMYDSSPKVDYLNVVAACDKDGKIIPTSNYGKCITLMAPGKDIVCTDHKGNVVSGNGTSFAAVIAAGVASLIENKVRDNGKFLKNTELDYVMKATTSLKPAGGWSEKAGFGMPDYKAAVKAVTP